MFLLFFIVIKQEIDMEESLKRKLDIICGFCNTTPKIINGSIRKIDKTNLSYIEPHRIIIKNILKSCRTSPFRALVSKLSKLFRALI